MLLTILLSIMMMAGLFLLLLGGVGFVQDKKFFSSAPQQIYDVVPDTKPERFQRSAHRRLDDNSSCAGTYGWCDGFRRMGRNKE